MMAFGEIELYCEIIKCADREYLDAKKSDGRGVSFRNSHLSDRTQQPNLLFYVIYFGTSRAVDTSACCPAAFGEAIIKVQLYNIADQIISTSGEVFSGFPPSAPHYPRARARGRALCILDPP
ncbi:hypothetical protein EVAR_18804_1 [Eumeta japonica]|uniref:Uncharacterized protein n=1 Tax=Eumeta variegata TaxID=151549 RepID=A0A4C1ULL4_EUMVA|nr:hypothetical protein EVAR_18804_1 [Eumeta japonica]